MALQYVGGQAQSITARTSATTTVNFSLTGGLASTPAAGDLVIVGFGTGSIANRTIGVTTAGYTEVAELYVSDSTGTNLSVSWKLMGSTPDTSVQVSPTGSNGDAGFLTIQVFRGVDTTTPLDVTSTTATGANAGIPNPAAIVPTSANTNIVVIGATGCTVVVTHTASYLSNFLTGNGAATIADVTMGAGWVNGPAAGVAYDPAAFTVTGSANTQSWATVTLALREAVPPQTYGKWDFESGTTADFSVAYAGTSVVTGQGQVGTYCGASTIGTGSPDGFGFRPSSAFRTTEIYSKFRFKVDLTANPSVESQIILPTFRDSATVGVTDLRVVVSSSGAMTLLIANLVTVTTLYFGTSISDNTWYDIEFSAIRNGAGASSVSLSVNGTNVYSTTTTDLGTAEIWYPEFSSLMGALNGIAGTVYYDEITLSTSPIVTNNATLDTAEAADTASFSVSLPTASTASLAATEANDTASMSLAARTDIALAATEANDTASMSLAARTDIALAATEANDTASMSLAARTNTALAATEGQDTASFAANVVTPEPAFEGGAFWQDAFYATEAANAFALAATEANDTASMALAARTNVALAATEALDTAAFALAARHTASLAATEANDTAAFALAARHTASLAATEALDTAAFALAAWTNITLAATEANDTAAFALAARHTASLAATEANDTASVSSSAYWAASLAATESIDTASFAVNTAVSVSLAATEASDTASASSSVYWLTTLAATEAADTAAFALAARHTASLAATEAIDTASVSSSVYWAASLAATEAADTAAFTLAARHTANLAATESPDTASVSSSVYWAASLAATEAADTASASSSVYWAATLAATEASDTASASSSVYWLTTLSVTESPDTAAFALAARHTAALAATEAIDTVSASSSVYWVANLTATEVSDTAAFALAARTNAALAATEAVDTASFTLTTRTIAVLAATETQDTASMTLAARVNLALAATEAQDTAQFDLIPTIVNLVATEAQDTAQVRFELPPQVILVGYQSVIIPAGTYGYYEVPYDLTGGVASVPRDGDVAVIVMAHTGDTLADFYTFTVGDTTGRETTPTFYLFGTDSDLGSGAALVYVYRNVHLISQSQGYEESSGAGDSLIDPPQINPAVPGARVLVIGSVAGVGTDADTTLSASYLENFTQVSSSGGTNNVTLAAGDSTVDAGPYDPAQWSSSSSNSGQVWQSISLALTPRVHETHVYSGYEAGQDVANVDIQWYGTDYVGGVGQVGEYAAAVPLEASYPNGVYLSTQFDTNTLYTRTRIKLDVDVSGMSTTTSELIVGPTLLRGVGDDLVETRVRVYNTGEMYFEFVGFEPSIALLYADPTLLVNGQWYTLEVFAAKGAGSTGQLSIKLDGVTVYTSSIQTYGTSRLVGVGELGFTFYGSGITGTVYYDNSVASNEPLSDIDSLFAPAAEAQDTASFAVSRRYQLLVETGNYTITGYAARLYESAFFYKDVEVIYVPQEINSVLISPAVQDADETIVVPAEVQLLTLDFEDRQIRVPANDPVEELPEYRESIAKARLRTA